MIKYAIFDVAGVLVQDQWIAIVRRLLNKPEMSKADVFDLWQTQSCFHDFETGKITTDVFIKQAIQALNLSITEDAFKRAFDDIILTPFERAEEVLIKVKAKYSLGVLSNTNDMHCNKILDNFNIYQHCEHLFLSHQMGEMKPSANIFNMMLSTLNCQPDEVLFFDDNMPNVLAARALGMNSELIDKPEQAYQYLELK